MEYERKILEDVFKVVELREKLRSVFNKVPNNPKSIEASEKARRKGNNLLLKQKNHDAQVHKAIYYHYCESIALAPIESQQLALAYANRSYFLLHIHKYEDSIKDIDQALKITVPDVLKTKLLCRKAECLKRLGSSDFLTILETVQKLINQMYREDRLKLHEKVNAVKNLIVINNTANDKCNENKRIEVPPITDDYLSRVSIDYNEKYGRHLIAAKDYEPGDLIFVEKIYASAFQEGSCLSACDYCSQPTWSTIPCNYCNWSMYCSDSCKQMAWNNFHEIDCPVIMYLKEVPYMEWAWKPTVLILRILITALKETGSVPNLRKELESLDQPTGFLENRDLVARSIKNIYFLTPDIDHRDLEGRATTVPFILTGLTKYSKLKNDFNVEYIKDLFIDKDVIFLGSLLIRIMSILNFNGHSFQSAEENQQCYIKKPSEILEYNDRSCLSTLYSLLNHSCSPTAHWCCTKPDKLLVFASQPIKKNSQIFITYGKCFYDEIPSERQAFYSEHYHFICDCQACVEKWPLMFKEDDMKIDDVRDTIKEVFGNILQEVSAALEEGQVNEEHIKKLIPLILQAINWKQPSPMLWAATIHLETVLTSIYSPKSLLFDQC